MNGTLKNSEKEWTACSVNEPYTQDVGLRKVGTKKYMWYHLWEVQNKTKLIFDVRIGMACGKRGKLMGKE